MIELKVNDMTCEHCVNTITKTVTSLDPGAKVEADLGTKRVRIDSSRQADELTKVLEEAGFTATAA
jgi:copper chaperone CopZ